MEWLIACCQRAEESEFPEIVKDHADVIYSQASAGSNDNNGHGRKRDAQDNGADCEKFRFCDRRRSGTDITPERHSFLVDMHRVAREQRRRLVPLKRCAADAAIHIIAPAVLNDWCTAARALLHVKLACCGFKLAIFFTVCALTFTAIRRAAWKGCFSVHSCHLVRSLPTRFHASFHAFTARIQHVLHVQRASAYRAPNRRAEPLLSRCVRLETWQA
mmetsp:Transcript_1841/g.4348  ORF Transcript_1841/g.4348 Transcript_1841/m.4348 type:complete len:217 (+) Transcript_1841:1007-1657(+)